MATQIFWFGLVFGGAFILRGIVATIFFYYILPENDRCPNCDAETLHVESRGWRWLLPGIRPSWCFECNWHGLLRKNPGRRSPDQPRASQPIDV